MNSFQHEAVFANPLFFPNVTFSSKKLYLMLKHVYWVGFDYTEAEMCVFDAQQQM